jgi:hypothetical protein
VGERVTVHVPGGDLVVELPGSGPGAAMADGGARDTLRLGGPVVHVFDTVVEL